jgi:hypothetical protein
MIPRVLHGLVKNTRLVYYYSTHNENDVLFITIFFGQIQFKLNHTNMNKWAVTLHNKNHMLTDEETMFGSTFVTMAVFDLFR